MKRITALFILLIILLCGSACKGNDADNDGSGEDNFSMSVSELEDMIDGLISYHENNSRYESTISVMFSDTRDIVNIEKRIELLGFDILGKSIIGSSVEYKLGQALRTSDDCYKMLESKTEVTIIDEDGGIVISEKDSNSLSVEEYSSFVYISVSNEFKERFESKYTNGCTVAYITDGNKQLQIMLDTFDADADSDPPIVTVTPPKRMGTNLFVDDNYRMYFDCVFNLAGTSLYGEVAVDIIESSNKVFESAESKNG